MAKTIEREDPVIKQCPNCLEPCASSEGRCHRCGNLLDERKEDAD